MHLPKKIFHAIRFRYIYYYKSIVRISFYLLKWVNHDQIQSYILI